MPEATAGPWLASATPAAAITNLIQNVNLSYGKQKVKRCDASTIPCCIVYPGNFREYQVSDRLEYLPAHGARWVLITRCAPSVGHGGRT